MNRSHDPIPLLPPMTPEDIEAFYRRVKNKPLTAEEMEFYRNPGETVPMGELITELEEILRNRNNLGAGQ